MTSLRERMLHSQSIFSLRPFQLDAARVRQATFLGSTAYRYFLEPSLTTLLQLRSDHHDQGQGRSPSKFHLSSAQIFRPVEAILSPISGNRSETQDLCIRCRDLAQGWYS